MKNIFLVTAAVFISLTSFAQVEKNLVNVPVSTVLDQSAQYTDKKLSLELISYEENVYSKSRKTEVGDQLKLNTRFRYQMNESVWMSVGFKTTPDVDRFDNKTSDFELRAGYNYENFVVQADLSINTDDDGGISFGMDLDSENTFLRYNMSDLWQLTFYPFNFDGEVGVEFETYDVTRIYYVEGTPSQINLQPDPSNLDERLANKTLPGFVLSYNKIKDRSDFLNLYLGLGAATYEFSNDPTYDIRTVSAGNSWSRRETIGYKFGGILRKPDMFTSFQFISQSEDEETGVLLKSAASLYSLNYLGNRLVLEAEITGSEGGSRPYRVDFANEWFDTDATNSTHLNQRVYSDIVGDNIQDWTGKWGFAGSLKLGLRKESYTPYISYKYHDKYFVFSGDQSAHKLRTNDLFESHGGLHRIGFGSYFYSGNFVVNPRFEYLLANNEVFSDSNDLTVLSTLPNLSDDDFIFFINVSYFYDKRTGPRTFRL
ncbi:MAG: hypothetical protein ACRBBP_11170 [Bdellovibrionales bacterium]